MKNLKKSQLIIFVIALMLVTAGYLNFTNNNNLIPTSSLADSEEMASIGDARLVNANQMGENANNTNKSEVATNNNLQNSQTTNSIQANGNNQTSANNQNNQMNQNTQSNQASQTNANVEDSYFTQSRLDRDNMYSQMLDNYQKILENEGLNSDEKSKAQTEIKRISEEKNAIMIAENLIKTKGFEDIVLFVNNGNVSAVVKEEQLDENKIAQIQNIITRELNVEVKKINVSNKK